MRSDERVDNEGIVSRWCWLISVTWSRGHVRTVVYAIASNEEDLGPDDLFGSRLQCCLWTGVSIWPWKPHIKITNVPIIHLQRLIMHLFSSILTLNNDLNTLCGVLPPKSSVTCSRDRTQYWALRLFRFHLWHSYHSLILCFFLLRGWVGLHLMHLAWLTYVYAGLLYRNTVIIFNLQIH